MALESGDIEVFGRAFALVTQPGRERREERFAAGVSRFLEIRRGGGPRVAYEGGAQGGQRRAREGHHLVIREVDCLRHVGLSVSVGS